MKTLYFVGNEELWNDAWFLALVESLKKKSSVSVVLYDALKDAKEIKTLLSEKVTPSDRVVVQKSLGLELMLPANLKGCLFNLSKEKVLAPCELAWGCTQSNMLMELGFTAQTNILEDAFLFDVNLASEVSKAIEVNVTSQLDAQSLSADAAEFSKFLDSEFPSNTKINIVKDTDPSLTGPSQLVIHNFGADTPGVASAEVPTLAAKNAGAADISIESSADDPTSVSHVDIPAADAPSIELPPVDAEPFGASQELEVPAVEPEPDMLKALGVEEFAILNSDNAPAPKTKIAENEVKVEPVKVPEVEVGHLISSMSREISGEDLDVIRRYSNIKERELREAQATAEALRRQIRYFDERLKKSEDDRRKSLLKYEEVQNELRTASDKKDENRAQLKNIESHYEEKVKELQIQLESSQFQAGKLEKKLEDFRERVRSDLQKIRSRERELASRLEIQKRDAEALLSAKDERLLNQKRDIDRLEFELDSLRERLLDDAQRGEERRKRIARALQSLKLAQSVLSGLDEESSQRDDKDKAA